MSSFLDTFPIWLPSLPISNDDHPLTESVSDLLLVTFPYDRLPDNNKWMSLAMHPVGVLLLVTVYIVSEPLLAQAVIRLDFYGNKSNTFQYLVALHNIALAIFSLVVAYNVWLLTFVHLASDGFESIYCDQDGQFWSTSGYGAWVTIFYLSKYYEFIDTWILILKRKKPSFLQLYHHVGVVVCMWGGVASHSAWLLIVVLLNSVIHTLMYTYFFIKTLYPEKQIKIVRYLTMAQIVQFISGISWTVGVLNRGEQCDTAASRVVAFAMDLYAVGLIILFTKFASKKYKKKQC